MSAIKIYIIIFWYEENALIFTLVVVQMTHFLSPLAEVLFFSRHHVNEAFVVNLPIHFCFRFKLSIFNVVILFTVLSFFVVAAVVLC